MNSPLASLPTSALGPMVDRAYREAVRCWAEVRDAKDPALRAVLLTGAEAAEVWWRDLRDELATRPDALAPDGPDDDETALEAVVVEVDAVLRQAGYVQTCPACGHRYSDAVPTRDDAAHDASCEEDR